LDLNYFPVRFFKAPT